MSTEPNPVDPLDLEQATQPTVDLAPTAVREAVPGAQVAVSDMTGVPAALSEIAEDVRPSEFPEVQQLVGSVFESSSPAEMSHAFEEARPESPEAQQGLFEAPLGTGNGADLLAPKIPDYQSDRLVDQTTDQTTYLSVDPTTDLNTDPTTDMTTGDSGAAWGSVQTPVVPATGWAGGGSTPPPNDNNFGQGPNGPDPSNPPQNATPPKKRRGALIGVGIGVLGLAGGVAFAFTQIRGQEKANTPVEAVQSFYTSFEAGDAIGMAKTLAPGERDVMLDSMVPMLAEMSRLNVLEKNFDPAKIKGYTAKLSNFKATSKEVRPDLAHVVVTSGKLSTTFNPNDLPFGDFVRKLSGKSLSEAESTTQSSDIGTTAESPFVVNKIGKRWYISLNYSAAESDRLGQENPYSVPAKGSGVAAKGAPTPEKAVAEMMQAMADLNVRRMIELVPPDEFAALHDYAGRFIDEANDATKEATKQYKLTVNPTMKTNKLADDRVQVTLTDLPFNLKVDTADVKVKIDYANSNVDAALDTTNGDTARLTWKNKILDASVKTANGDSGKVSWKNKTLNGSLATANGDKGTLVYKNKVLDAQFFPVSGEKISANYAKECFTLTVDGEEKKGCGQEGIAKLFSDLTGQPIDTSTLNSQGLGFGSKCASANRKVPTIGFTVIKRDGAWYVSPTRTVLDSMTAVMRSLDPKDVECIRDEIKKSIDSVTGSVNNPDAIDPTFIDPIDPDSDPFATDTFPDFPADSSPFPSEDDFTFDEPTSDTFASEVDGDAVIEGIADVTIAFEPIDSDSVDGGPTVDTTG